MKACFQVCPRHLRALHPPPFNQLFLQDSSITIDNISSLKSQAGKYRVHLMFNGLSVFFSVRLKKDDTQIQ